MQADRNAHRPERVAGGAQRSAVDDHHRVGQNVKGGQAQHADGQRSRLGEDRVRANGLEDGDQLLGETDEKNQDDRRIGPAHLQPGDGHPPGDIRPAGPHVAPDQTDDADLNAEQRDEGNHVPVEDDGDRGGGSQPVGMENQDHGGEGEQIEEELHPGRRTETQQLAHHLVIVAREFYPEFPAVGPGKIGRQQDEQTAQAAENGPVSRPPDPQRRNAEAAEDQHVIGADVDQHRRQRREHDHPGPADSGEEAGEAAAQQAENGAAEQNVEVELLRLQLRRRDVGKGEEPVGQGPGGEDQRISEQGDKNRLRRDRGAAVLASGAEILRRQSGRVADQAEKESRHHEGGEPPGHGGAHLHRAETGEEEPVGKDQHCLAGVGDDHRQGDGQHFPQAACCRPGDIRFFDRLHNHPKIKKNAGAAIGSSHFI